MGKEQDLLLKERVRRIAQLEAQDDAEAMKPHEAKTAAQATQSKLAACNTDILEDPEEYRDCSSDINRLNTGPGERGGGVRSPELPGPNGEEPTLPPTDRILQAQAGQNPDDALGAGDPGGFFIILRF